MHGREPLCVGSPARAALFRSTTESRRLEETSKIPQPTLALPADPHPLPYKPNGSPALLLACWARGHASGSGGFCHAVIAAGATWWWGLSSIPLPPRSRRSGAHQHGREVQHHLQGLRWLPHQPGGQHGAERAAAAGRGGGGGWPGGAGVGHHLQVSGSRPRPPMLGAATAASLMPTPTCRSWDEFHACASGVLSRCPEEAAAIWESLRQESRKIQFQGNLQELCSARGRLASAQGSPPAETNQATLRGSAPPGHPGILPLLALVLLGAWA